MHMEKSKNFGKVYIRDVILNKILITFIIFVSALNSNPLKKINLQKETIDYLKIKVIKAEKEYNDKIDECETKQKNIIINPLLFKNVKYTAKELRSPLGILELRASENCIKEKQNNYIIVVQKIIKVGEFYKKDMEIAKRTYPAKTITDIFGEVNIDIIYNKSLDTKTRHYLNNIKELKKPFNLTETLKLIKKIKEDLK